MKYTVKKIPAGLSFFSHSPSVSPAPDLEGVQNHMPICWEIRQCYRATLAGLRAAGTVQAPTFCTLQQRALLQQSRKAAISCDILETGWESPRIS